MTNEEIQQRAERVLVAFLGAAARQNDAEVTAEIARGIREAVSQAYEEAAQKALIFDDEYIAANLEIVGSPAIKLLVQQTGRGIASSIRALKDSLSSVEPSRRPLSEHPRITDRHSIR